MIVYFINIDISFSHEPFKTLLTMQVVAKPICLPSTLFHATHKTKGKWAGGGGSAVEQILCHDKPSILSDKELVLGLSRDPIVARHVCNCLQMHRRVHGLGTLFPPRHRNS